MQEVPAGPLCRAAVEGNIAEVKRLLAAGANPNGRDHELLPLIEAADAGHAEVVQLLLSAGADPRKLDYMGYTPSSSNLEIVQLLLAAGTPVRSATPTGETGVHLAASARNWELLKFWLGKGLTINERDAGGYTALHLAAFRGQADRVSQLLKLGADPKIPANNGVRPLGTARAEGHAAIVKLLRAAGAK